ncbi:MAG: type II toxin-antitoxin system VapB family antitoxin [Pseudomonadota bacterium]
MPLNVKDEEVHRQARRLAMLTGCTITSAVREAIEMRLRQVEAEQSRNGTPRTAEALLQLGRECAALMGKSEHSSDHAALYGEDGLPK